MARTESVSITSDLTGITTTYTHGADPAPVNITVFDQSGTVDLAANERDALIAFITTGDPAALFAITDAARGVALPAPVKAKAKAKTPAADAGELPAIRNYLATNNHANSTVREWAHVNGFPDVEPGKAGKLPGAALMAYAKAHGYVSPAPAADAATAPTEPVDAAPAATPEPAPEPAPAAAPVKATPAKTPARAKTPAAATA